MPRESPLQRSRTGAETVLLDTAVLINLVLVEAVHLPVRVPAFPVCGARAASGRAETTAQCKPLHNANHCTMFACKRLTFTFNCVRTKISNPAPGWVWEYSNDVRRPLVEVRGHVEQLRDPPVDHCAGGTVRPDAAVVVCVRALGAARAGDLRVQPSVACVPAPCATRPCIR